MIRAESASPTSAEPLPGLRVTRSVFNTSTSALLIRLNFWQSGNRLLEGSSSLSSASSRLQLLGMSGE